MHWHNSTRGKKKKVYFNHILMHMDKELNKHSGMVENIEKAVTDQLKAIPVSDFQCCYEEWEQHLRRCVASQGNYFEGHKLDL